MPLEITMPDAVFFRWKLPAPPGAPGPIYTNAKLTAEDAARMFPGAVAVEESREVRFVWDRRSAGERVTPSPAGDRAAMPNQAQ